MEIDDSITKKEEDQFEDQSRRKDSSESLDTEDSCNSHHRSPESVLFEWQSAELSCCKQISPKITPRQTKPSLNLDIPEPGSDDNESDRTDSLTYKTSPCYECNEQEFTNAGATINALEKTISVDRMFGTNSQESMEIQRKISIDPEIMLSDEFMSLELLSTSYKLPRKNTRNNILYDKKLFSPAQTSSKVELPENLSNCSKFLSRELTTLDERKTCDYFDIPLSSYERNIEKIHCQSEFKRMEENNVVTKKRKNCENLQITANNEEVNYFFTTKVNSPPTKKCRTALKYEDIQEPMLFLPTIEVHRPLVARTLIKNDKHSDQSANNKHWDEWPKTLMSVDLASVSDCDYKTTKTDSYVTIDLDSTSESQFYEKTRSLLMSRVGDVKIAVARVTAFCQWLAKQIMIIMKKSYGKFRRIFGSRFTWSPNSSSNTESDLTNVVSLIRSENERILSIISDKVNLLSNELIQVRESYETNVEALRTEINELKTLNVKLVDNNDLLTKELRNFAEIREETKPMTSMKTVQMCAPPPPPPPPPPPMSQMITPTTPNRSRKRPMRTPTRKCSTPLLDGRPPITVEDLLKVTLKKAPQNNKENRRDTISAPRGPVVSLDMLRSVKLKSARRKSNDYSSRSPRRAHSLKNRPTTSMTLSPIMAGAESPLGRILRQADGRHTRRASKRRLTSPTHSENDLTRESPKNFEGPRQKMSRSVIT